MLFEIMKEDLESNQMKGEFGCIKFDVAGFKSIKKGVSDRGTNK